jgi:hypothetical protein
MNPSICPRPFELKDAISLNGLLLGLFFPFYTAKLNLEFVDFTDTALILC